MKQRIAVRAIIQQDNKTLVLRRANGRPTILGQFELPGGKLAYGEQPEDSLRRYLHDDIGLHIKTAHLFDAVTYIDRDDRDIQYTVLVYNVSVVQNGRPIKLSGNYDKYLWQSMSKSHHSNLTDLTQLLLGIIQQEEITDESLKIARDKDVNKSSDSVTIFTDGGSRGNPGPSAAGFVIINSQQEAIAEGGVYLGVTTNNQAEYHGVRIGMERAIEMGFKNIHFRIDSMLVVNQMKGFYKIKNRELWPIHERIRELMKKFDTVTFTHVQREFNQLADGMVNKTLDAEELKRKTGV